MLLIFIGIATPVQAAVKDSELHNCEQEASKGYEIRNDCFVALAYKYQDARICDNIQFSVKSGICRRTILLVKPNIWVVLSVHLLLVYAILIWFAFVWFFPPRVAYAIGAVVGMVSAGAYLLVTHLQTTSFFVPLVPYIQYLLVPTNGLQFHAPDWFYAWPIWSQILFVQALFYSAVVGLILQQSKRTYIWATVTIVLCIALSLYEPVIFGLFTQSFAFIKSLFLN